MRKDADAMTLGGGGAWIHRQVHLLDALAWFMGFFLLLLLILPVGYVSGDTIPLAERLVQGNWLWNPNRLLTEPASWVWLRFLSPFRLGLSVPDQLSILSMLSGAVSIGVVRGWIAPKVATRRWVANFATSWFALGSAWAIVLLYGYPVMLQMPFLVLMAALLLRSCDDRRRALLLLATAGAAGGVAALAWISNALLVASLGIAFGILAWNRNGPRVAALRVAVFGGSAIVVLFLPLALVWSQVVVTDSGFLSWLRSYGGGVDSRLAEGYGLKLGLVPLVMALVRASYGAAMTIVDLSPLAAWYRGADIDGFRLGARIVAFLLGVSTLLILVVGISRTASDWARDRVEVLVLMAAWIAPIMFFGVLWDNSDDKFYFQLAVPLAMAAGTMDWWWTRKMWPVVAIATLPLLYNAFDVMDRYVLYDRQGKVSALETAYEGAGAVLMPGYEDVAKLSYFVPYRGERRRSVTWYADRYAPDEGLRELQQFLAEARDSCERIVVVEIMARTAIGNPWTVLGAGEGYGIANLQRMIAFELPGLEVYEEAGFSFATWPGREQHPSCAARTTDE